MQTAAAIPDRSREMDEKSWWNLWTHRTKDNNDEVSSELFTRAVAAINNITQVGNCAMLEIACGAGSEPLALARRTARLGQARRAQDRTLLHDHAARRHGNSTVRQFVAIERAVKPARRGGREAVEGTGGIRSMSWPGCAEGGSVTWSVVCALDDTERTRIIAAHYFWHLARPERSSRL
jgi:hypothetical protein